MDKPFKFGDRVMTPQGVGTVQYTRNGPPTYAKTTAVSVILDRRAAEDASYTGTIFDPKDVKLVNAIIIK